MYDKVIILAVMLGSLGYLNEAKQLSFGTLQSPKSGFLPLLAALAALLLSALLLLRQFKAGAKPAAQQEPVDWTKFIFVIIGLLFYITILTNIGYFAATLILLFYLFKVADTAGWLFPLLLASTGSVAFYLLFARYLAIPLP
ncbi:MAG: tripartite tricarboxylate transporter TctB family protein [Sporomusaceae bacterium]|nr:tripartite tricarboxylate transporter TctB family protein [Sporomusaceae bacterium]